VYGGVKNWGMSLCEANSFYSHIACSQAIYDINMLIING
jgi:hypothetical protein